MKKNLTLFLLLCSFISYACGNYYFALNKDGDLIMLGTTWQFPFSKNFDPHKHVKRLQKIESELKKTRNYMLLSDYALVLMKLGKTKEALELLKVLYKHYPGEYKIATNLGTAYELNGQPDSALKYIRIDMKLNPHDHEGSEWIHAKILETKLAIAKDPAWLKTHSVLELTDAQKKDSIVWKHLNVQLQERVPFTPGPDNMVADLFVDLGDITANIGTIHYAHVYYNIAKKYYGSTDPAIDEKIKKMDALLKKYENIKPDNFIESDGKIEKGMATKIHKLRYQDILINNNRDNFAPDWSKLNLDITNILSLADFSKTPLQIKDSIEASKTTGDFTLLKDDHDTIEKIEAADSTNITERKALGEISGAEKSYSMWIFIGIGTLVVVLLGLVLYRKKK